jgi:O-antigen ligase
MLTLLIFFALLIWLPVSLILLTKRPLAVLLIWLVVGPVVSNAVKWPGANPFFFVDTGAHQRTGNQYADLPTTITVKELLEPTRVLVLVMVTLLAADRLVRKRRRLPMDRPEKAMLFFSILLVLSSVFMSTKTAFGLRISVDVFVIPFLCYALARRFIPSDFEFSRLNKAVFYLGLYVTAACVAERLLNSHVLYRLKGPFVQGPYRGSSILHVVIIVIFFAALLELLTRRYRREGVQPAAKRELLWLLLLTSPAIVMLTWARGNWVGLIVGLWVFLLLGRRLLMSRRRLAIDGMVLLIIPLVAVAIISMRSSWIMDARVGEVDNVQGRLTTWRAVMDLGLQTPLTGIGLNDTREFLASPESGDETYTTVHNSFLTFFVELGVVGLIGYLAIIFSLGQAGYRLYYRGRSPREQWRGLTVIAVLIAYLLPGMFANTLHMFGFGHVLVFAFLGGLIGATYHPENLLHGVLETSARERRRPVSRGPVSVTALRRF